MDARRRKSIKKASLRQEKQTAEDIGGRTQANSGATRLGGGADVRGTGMRVECKFTEKSRYTLKLSELEKLRKQALKTLEYPVFQFAFKFRNTMEKYAVTKFQTELESNPCNAQTMWLGIASITIDREEIKQCLDKGLLLVTLDRRVFKIQYWDDFVSSLSKFKDVSIGWIPARTGPCHLCTPDRPCHHATGVTCMEEEG